MSSGHYFVIYSDEELHNYVYKYINVWKIFVKNKMLKIVYSTIAKLIGVAFLTLDLMPLILDLMTSFVLNLKNWIKQRVKIKKSKISYNHFSSIIHFT